MKNIKLKMSFLWYRKAFLLCLLLFVVNTIETEETGWEMYNVLEDAPDTMESMHVLSSLQLRHFSFNYDTKLNRQQLGFLGEEVASVVPEAVRRMPWRQGGNSDVVIEDFAHVDNNVLFSHTLGALKEVSHRQVLLEKDVRILHDESEDISLKLIRIAEYRGQEWQTAAQIRGIRRAIEKEVEAVEEKLSVIRGREESHREAMVNQTMQEFFLLNMEYELALSRAEYKKSSAATLRQEEEKLTLDLGRREEQLKLEAGLASLNFTVSFKRQQLEQEAGILGQVATAAAREAAMIERENEDLRLRQFRAEAQEARRAMQEGLVLVFSFVGGAASNLLDKPLLMARTLAVMLAISSALIITRQVILFTRQFLLRKLARPALIREANRMNILRRFLKALSFSRSKIPDGERLKGIFIASDLQSQVTQLIKSTRSAHARGANLRHVLLHGPPGTGKTLLAKRIAELSGLDFAVMSGGDLGPLGSQAVTELQKVLQWSKSNLTGRRGLLLLIDEAEAALGDRTKIALSEGGKNALNALLYETGEQSSDLMLVLATSRPSDMDTAILDRIDEMIHLALPRQSERREIIDHLLHRFVCHTDKQSAWNTISLLASGCSSPRIKLNGIDLREATDELAQMTEGFSGRELYKIIMSLQAKAHGTEACILDKKAWVEIIDWKIKEFHSKQKFIKHPSRILSHCFKKEDETIFENYNNKNDSERSKEELEPEVTPYSDQDFCPETMEEVMSIGDDGRDDNSTKSADQVLDDADNIDELPSPLRDDTT